MTTSNERPERPGGLVQYLWPLRVPLVSGLLLVGLQWVAFRPGVTQLLSGIFDPVDDSTMAIVTAVALFNAWSIVVIWRLILAYGADRLDLPRTTWQFFPVPVSTWLLGSVLAMPVIGRAFWYATAVAPSGVHRFRGMLIAALVGAAVACGLLVASLRLSDRIDRQAPRFRSQLGAGLSGLYDRFLAWFSKRRWLSAGFIAVDRNGAYQPRLARGHGLAFFLALASLVLYVVTGILTRNIDKVLLASALTYVLLLQLVLTWAVGLAAFLLDRTRVPLAVYFVIWIVVVDAVIDRVFSTDHIYRTVELAGGPPRATPSELLRGAEPAVLIAVSGGGIQAAAWAARVLTGLSDAPGFRSQVRFISAVSGGSVGAMNFLAFSPDCGPAVDPGPHDDTFDANTASEASSLHAVGRGLVFKDLPRTVLPFFSTPFVDRGSQLEDAWKREARLRKPYPDAAALLSSWRQNVPQRRCPGVVYNAMAAETGQPMLFATVALPDALKPFDFYEHYQGRDVPLTTAVRLSSGFPYVAPAARADADDLKKHYTHLVDGGYFDNYGVGTLSAWTHAALMGLASGERPSRLLVIEICDSEFCSGREPAAVPSEGGSRRAWPYQLIAPLSAVVAMRSAAQQVTNRTSLRLLKQDLACAARLYRVARGALRRRRRATFMASDGSGEAVGSTVLDAGRAISHFRGPRVSRGAIDHLPRLACPTAGLSARADALASHDFWRSICSRSIGSGKMMVEFFSAEISVSVCRYRNVMASGSWCMTAAACESFADAISSPSA